MALGAASGVLRDTQRVCKRKGFANISPRNGNLMEKMCENWRMQFYRIEKSHDLKKWQRINAEKNAVHSKFIRM